MERDHVILIAEDDQSILRMLHRALQREGYQVLTAPDGRQALALAEQHRPALLISDVRMPGMDGIQLVRSVHDRLQDSRPKVILMSAFEVHVQHHADLFLPKPFDLGDLLDAIRRLMAD